MNKTLLFGGAVFVTAVAALWFVTSTPAKTPTGQACTMEAKLCSDGSYVSRAGPNCEFALCLAPAAVSPVAVGAKATINGTRIGVLELLEDSRCPVDVQCIQAGTVRVRTSIDSYNKDFTFTLLQPQVVGDLTITLASVIPSKKNATQTVQASDYRFTFTVVPIKNPTPAGSGIRGTVLLGPTCPVLRDPPDPQCADKAYTTTIQVYRAGFSAVVATGKSGVTGTFEISLQPGTYTVVASGGTMLPRCSSVEAVVSQAKYSTIRISCDTGIR